MIRMMLTALCLIGIVQIYCQKNDYIWLFGYRPNMPENRFGGSLIDFNSNPADIRHFETPVNLDGSIAIISDEQGSLIAYSNGCRILNGAHELMSDGDSINTGAIFDSYCDGSYPYTQGMTFITSSANDADYILLYLWINGVFFRPEQLRYAEITHEPVKGEYIVSGKDIIAGSGPFTSGLAAVRHANGRDWWILLPRFASNIFYMYLSYPSGIELMHTQQIGTTWDDRYWSGQYTFSPDGSKFARINPFNDLHIYDFDRCTGLLSNPVAIDFDGEFTLSSGVAFSSNNRFLYATTTLHVYQYDLWEDDVAASRETVAVYDDFGDPFGAYFFQLMLAPDGRIYGSAPNSVHYLHVIHKPNNKGLACNVEQQGIELPTLHAFAVPNFPHFKLGSLEGSLCDTIGKLTITDHFNENALFTIFPNPTSSDMTLNVDSALLDRQTPMKWFIFDISGTFVSSGIISDNISRIPVDVDSGVYVIFLYLKNGEIYFKRMVVSK